MCDVKRLLQHNVKVGLGTGKNFKPTYISKIAKMENIWILDMSGGYGHSLMDAMRQALSVSICISFNKEGYKPMDFKNVFYLATLGGAQGKKSDHVQSNGKM